MERVVAAMLEDVRRLSEESRRSRHDLDVQFNRIAELQAHLDETLAKLEEISAEWQHLKRANAEVVDALTRTREARRSVKGGRRIANHRPAR